MDELRDVVDWNDEIKRFLEARVDELYRRKIIEELEGWSSCCPRCLGAV
jgi:hypothetical protein